MPKATSKSSGRPRGTDAATVRTLPWTYLHLTLLPATAAAPDLDEITVRTHMTAALTRYLGLHGSAVAIDILRVMGRDAWVRVPVDDGAAVVEALSGWVVAGVAGDLVGWRVNGRSEWLGALTAAGDRRRLFDYDG